MGHRFNPHGDELAMTNRMVTAHGLGPEAEDITTAGSVRPASDSTSRIIGHSLAISAFARKSGIWRALTRSVTLMSLRCCCREKRAREKGLSRASSTIVAPAATARSSRSTAPLSQRRSWRQSSSALRPAPSLTLGVPSSASLKLLQGVRCSWMRSIPSPCPSRASCSTSSRRSASDAWERW